MMTDDTSASITAAGDVVPPPPTQVQKQHANRHVGKFLSVRETDVDDTNTTTMHTMQKNHQYKIQIVNDGRNLTARRLMENNSKDLTLTLPILIKDKPESIGMKVLSFETRQVSIRDIADIIGHYWPVHVIDVEHQEELEGWTITDLVDYFEDEERLLRQHQEEATRLFATSTSSSSSSSNRRGSSRSGRIRKAAEKCNVAVSVSQKRPRVLNQISLEFSDTPLRKHMQSPQFVRDIDWIDHAWPRPKEENEKQQQPQPNNNSKKDLMIPPRVQYYCLTSAGGCYTDFHLDFGGTSVWYHVLSGEKTFCLIPPTDTNLATYEDWLCRPNQSDIFLPDLIQDQTEEVIRITLKANQTLIIPAGWIHAVYTPVDSVVIGGNFLHGLDISVQLKVHCLESRTRVQEKFRFPHFLPINFYAGGMYLQKLRQGKIYPREVEGLSELITSLDSWWKVYSQGASKLQTGPTVFNAAHEASRQNNCTTVEEFLEELRVEHQRVLQHGISPNPKYLCQQSKPPTPPSSSSSSSSPTKIKLKLKLNKSSVATAPKPQLPVASPPPLRSSTTSTGNMGAASSSTSTTTTVVARAADTTTNKNNNNKFRIVVSSSAHKTIPPIRNKRKKREDTEWVYDPTTADDEWTPTGREDSSRKKKKKATKVGIGSAGGTSSSSSSSGSGTTSNKNGKGKPPSSKQPPKVKFTTARQRLMKRLGG